VLVLVLVMEQALCMVRCVQPTPELFRVAMSWPNRPTTQTQLQLSWKEYGSEINSYNSILGDLWQANTRWLLKGVSLLGASPRGPLHTISSYLLENKGTLITSINLSNTLFKVSSSYFREGLTINPYRHLTTPGQWARPWCWWHRRLHQFCH
jgi:hypothetical protein